MVRVLHLITDLKVGGAEMMLHKLLESMKTESLIQSEVITLSNGGPIGELIRKQGISVKSLGFIPGRISLKGFIKLRKHIRAFNPDVVQTWLYHGDFVGTLAVLTMGKRKKLYWNIRCSNMELENYRPSVNWVIKACTWLSVIPDGIIFNSVNAMSYHQGIGYRPRRTHIIPNGFDIDMFKPDPCLGQHMIKKHRLDEDHSTLGIIARFDPMKDHLNFLKASAVVKNTIPNLRLVMCGAGMDWDNHKLVEMIENLGLRPNTLLMGIQRNIPRVMNMLDLAISASAYGEGFPNVVCEAMACGVPCVVTDVGDSALIVGETGKVVPPREPKALAEAILDLLKLPQGELQHLKKRARERIAENYTIKKIMTNYRELYVGS